MQLVDQWRTAVVARLAAEAPEPVLLFWRWWMGELREALPWLFRHGQRLVIRLDQAQQYVTAPMDGREEPAAIDWAPLTPADPASPSAHPICFMLSEDCVLRRSLRFPITAERHLRQVVSMQMDRLTPFGSDELYFDVRLVRRDKDRKEIVVDLVAARREEVDGFTQQLSALGWTPALIDVPLEASGGPAGFNLLREAGIKQATSERSRLRKRVVLAAAGFCCLAIGLSAANELRARAELGHDLKEARASAAQAAAQRAALSDLAGAVGAPLHRRQDEPLKIEILADLSQRLPNHTWLQSLTLSDDEVELRGLSEKAVDLIPALSDSAFLTEIGFRSPVTEAGDGKERFHIIAALGPGVLGPGVLEPGVKE